MEYYPYLYVILSIQPTTNNAMITTILYVSKKVYNDYYYFVLGLIRPLFRM